MSKGLELDLKQIDRLSATDRARVLEQYREYSMQRQAWIDRVVWPAQDRSWRELIGKPSPPPSMYHYPSR
jgi:hypothetical protein